MIVHMRGSLLEKDASHIVIEVSGIGYELGVSDKTLYDIEQAGDTEVSVYVRMRITEQAALLYGFSTKEERTVFDKLILISGVGPKVALAVLSTFSVNELASLVLAQDAEQLTAINGVGKKMANRLVVELQSLFADDEQMQVFLGASQSGASAPQDATAEALQALLAMGFSVAEAQDALKGVPNDAGLTSKQIIQYALKHIGGAL